MRSCLTLRENDSHLQVARRQPDDGRFVQLGGDGRRQWQHFSQLVKLAVLLFPSSPCGRFGFLLHFGSFSLYPSVSEVVLIQISSWPESSAHPLLFMAGYFFCLFVCLNQMKRSWSFMKVNPDMYIYFKKTKNKTRISWRRAVTHQLVKHPRCCCCCCCCRISSMTCNAQERKMMLFPFYILTRGALRLQ